MADYFAPRYDYPLIQKRVQLPSCAEGFGMLEEGKRPPRPMHWSMRNANRIDGAGIDGDVTDEAAPLSGAKVIFESSRESSLFKGIEGMTKLPRCCVLR